MDIQSEKENVEDLKKNRLLISFLWPWSLTEAKTFPEKHPKKRRKQNKLPPTTQTAKLKDTDNKISNSKQKYY